MEEIALVLDLRRGGHATGLAEEILRGLRAQPRSLPSLLLWNGPGLKLFDELARDAVYYPAKKEADLIERNVNTIAARIAVGSVIIELGSGNLSKTAVLLKALAGQKKSFKYFALDVSLVELQKSLARLAQELPGSAEDIRGLCGTYEDFSCALNSSLHHLRSSHLTFLWFGNSVANATVAESFGLLNNLLNNGPGGPKAQAMVAVDGCHVPSQVLKAYGSATSAHREFLMNGLIHANKVLDREIFVKEDWELKTAFDISEGLMTQNYVARRHLEITVEHERFKIRPGEHVKICQSAKWNSAKVSSLVGLAGMLVLTEWQNEDRDYGMYLLCKDQD